VADRRPRRWWRAVGLAHAAVALAYAGAVLLGMPAGWPYDVATNLGTVAIEPAFAAPADGKRRVVVLLHGLWRSSASMGRMARTLATNGYEVHNVGYPSCDGWIGEHAARLRRVVEQLAAHSPIDELSFVAHSMGGLVVEEYLRRPDARTPFACVYVATPHRGAILCDLRKHWWPFRLAMGEKAAMQLSPSDPFHRQPIPVPAPAGTIAGDLGAGNASIPGADDGTVALAEASFAGATAAIVLPVGHTSIAADPRTIRQVAAFLRQRTFAPLAAAR
jgi:pimeloyl-ACP methyl ester carboxylesterase